MTSISQRSPASPHPHQRSATDLSIDPFHNHHEQPAYFVDVIERNRKFPFKGWGTNRLPKDPPTFADGTGSVARPLEKVSKELPSQCEWVTEWEVVEDEDAEGDIITIPQRSPTSGATKLMPVRVKRDAEGWLYGKDFNACNTSDASNTSCRARTHRRVFKFKAGIENTVEVFPALFRCLIVDEKFAHTDAITYDMLREAGGSEEDLTHLEGGGRRRSSSAASTALSVPESVMLFKFLPDEHADSCMDNTCGKTFNTFRRRHHCRSCGLIYCGSCAPKRSEFDDVRICNPCAKMDHNRKAELVMEISMRNEETKAIQKEPSFSEFTEPPTGALMLKFQIQQNQNLETKIRSRIYDEEDKALTAAAVRWLEMILPRDEEAQIKDHWEAARRSGGRAGMATLSVGEGMGIDKGHDPTTFLVVNHESRPEVEFHSETIKRSSNPKYNFRESWPIFDDTKPFTITIMAERTIGKPKAIAVGTFIPATCDTNRRKAAVVGTLYYESGLEDIPLKAPVGTAAVPGSLCADWRIEYREAMEESGLEFCSGCGRVLPHACVCAEDVRAKIEEEKQAKIDEVDAVRGQVTSERLMMEHLHSCPRRPQGGGSTEGEEARVLFDIGFKYLMEKYPPPPPPPKPKDKPAAAQLTKPIAAVTTQSQAALSAVGGQLSSLGKAVSFGALTKVASLTTAKKEKVKEPEVASEPVHQVEVKGPSKEQDPAAAPVVISSDVAVVKADQPLPKTASQKPSRPRPDESKESQRPRRGQRKEESKCCHIM